MAKKRIHIFLIHSIDQLSRNNKTENTYYIYTYKWQNKGEHVTMCEWEMTQQTYELWHLSSNNEVGKGEMGAK